jgi:hypothetical protein
MLNLETEQEDLMLWTVAIVLFVLWALGFLAFNVGSGLIHLLVVAAVILVLYQLISGRRRLA